MTIAALRKRVKNLSLARVVPERCPGGNTIILDYVQGQPKPEIPADAPQCRLCGHPHVMYLEEIIDEAEASST